MNGARLRWGNDLTSIFSTKNAEVNHSVSDGCGGDRSVCQGCLLGVGRDTTESREPHPAGPHPVGPHPGAQPTTHIHGDPHRGDYLEGRDRPETHPLHTHKIKSEKMHKFEHECFIDGADKKQT